MALADYYLCDRCGRKTFYDADLPYEYDERVGDILPGVGAMLVLCEKCAATHELVVRKKGDQRR